MTYAEKLEHPAWQKKRLSVLNRDNFTCQICKDRETQLHVHHLKYTAKFPQDEPEENLQTLCKYCHRAIEVIKKHSPRKTIRLFHPDNVGLYMTETIDGIYMYIIDHNLDVNIITAFSKDHLEKIVKHFTDV